MAIVCIIAVIAHFNKFPNLGVYDANFPNLNGPGAPSQNCKKSLVGHGFNNFSHFFVCINQTLKQKQTALLY